MDCPDRERGQWIGDVSVQAPQVFFVFDEKAKKLLKKSILDFIRLRKGDVLVGNVPGEHFSELPSQSLVAISEFGLLAEYYNYSLDPEIPELVLEPIVNYLKLWRIDEKGLLVGREGNWRWFDHLWNVDEDVLENCLYVSACKFALRMAELCGNHEHDAFLKQRSESLTALIEENFWKGQYYSSRDFVDDRANAIAVLSGDALLTAAFSAIAKSSHSAAIRIRAVEILSECAGELGMVGGQVLDMQSQERQCTRDEVIAIQSRKTGALIRAASMLGVLAARGSEKQLAAAGEFADNLGLAFQIRDDVLDVVGDAQTLGKAVGTDADKNTFVQLYGLEKCNELIAAHTEKALGALNAFEDTDFMSELAKRLTDRIS